MPYSPTTWADTPATTSPISAANLNKIETELARLKVNADLDPAAAIAYSKLALALSIVNGDVSASAAIAYSKLNLASSIVNADVASAAAIALSKLADPGSGNVVTSAGSGAIAAKPPGYRYSLDSFTAAVNSVATTEAGATTVKTSSSVAYDGTAIWIEFQCAVLSSSVAGGGIWLSFFDGATAIGKARFGSDANGVASPGLVRVPFTPSAGAHTFTVKIWATTASTVSAQAGLGGTDTQLPGFIQVTKA